MNQYYVGSSGYSYRDWVGPFSPPGTPAGEYLAYYARHFSFVELNFSYYRQPESAMIERIRAQVPEDFLFSIKAHQSLTHHRGEDWQRELDTYRRGIEPLLDHGQCAAVLLQFPYSFRYQKENRLYLDALLQAAEELPLVVEFRNVQWERDSVLRELRERGVSWVMTDTPQLRGLSGELKPTVSAEDAYVRFHGRNEQKWWSGDNTSRYDYLYSREHLEFFADSLADTPATRLFAAFNNHRKAQAVRNAQLFLQLLDQKSGK